MTTATEEIEFERRTTTQSATGVTEVDVDFEKHLVIPPNLPLNPAFFDEVDIGSEWRTLKRLPEHIYLVHKGDGLNSMALWHCRVHGAFKAKDGGWHQRQGWRWSYSFKELLYCGSMYTSHERRPQDYNGSKRFSTPIKDAYYKQAHITLGAALDALEEHRQHHLLCERDRHRQHLEEIASRQKWLAESNADIARSQPVRLGSLKINLEEHALGD